jgi:hypothetical protein
VQIRDDGDLRPPGSAAAGFCCLLWFALLGVSSLDSPRPSTHPQTPAAGAFSIQIGTARRSTFPSTFGCEQRRVVPSNSQGEIMSKDTLALIVSEIVAGYGKIVRRKGKLYAVSSR